MASQYTMSGMNLHPLAGNVDWAGLYQALNTSVEYWVYAHMVPSWVGQEEDLVSDIVQETIVRVWDYLCRQEREQVVPVKSLPNFCRTVAINYGRDLQRHDKRLKRADSQDQEYIAVYRMVEDVAVEYMYQNELFVFVAAVIRDFPEKQRNALLTDLACHTDFHGPPTLLQQTFLRVGIQLKDYQQPLPKGATGRNRYLSLLSIAYKRLRNVMSKLGGDVFPEVGDRQVTGMVGVQQECLEKQDTQCNSREVSTQTFMYSSAASSLRVE